METINISAPSQEVLLSQVNPMLEMCKALKIDSDDMYKIASDELSPIKAKRKVIEETRKSIVEPLNTAVKRVNDLFREPIAICDQAEEIIKAGMVGWIRHKDQIEQEARRKREAEERALREEQEKEQERLQAEIDALAAEGKVEEAAALEVESMAITMAPVVIEAPIETTKEQLQVKGTSIARPWKARVISKIDLIKYIANRSEFEHLLQVDQGALDKLAKALKENMKLDGVEAYEDIQIGKRV